MMYVSYLYNNTINYATKFWRVVKRVNLKNIILLAYEYTYVNYLWNILFIFIMGYFEGKRCSSIIKNVIFIEIK